SKVYGAKDPVLTGLLVGFLTGDEVTATYARSQGQQVGAYLISAALHAKVSLEKYAITVHTAPFIITKAAPTVTATGNTCEATNLPCKGRGTAVGAMGEKLVVTVMYRG